MRTHCDSECNILLTLFNLFTLIHIKEFNRFESRTSRFFHSLFECKNRDILITDNCNISCYSRELRKWSILLFRFCILKEQISLKLKSINSLNDTIVFSYLWVKFAEYANSFAVNSKNSTTTWVICKFISGSLYIIIID